MRYDQQQQQQPPSDDRPKLFMPPPAYGHFLPHGIPHHTPIKYEPYFPPPVASMLHVSSDFQAHGNDAPASASSSNTSSNSAKRSREELNRKEKQRMSKLNERIDQLKQLLDDAGVQTKKNKQAVLDNTAHLIEKLQTDLQIAQQKAERAEKQAQNFRSQAPRGGQAAEKVARRVFENATMPRLLVDVQLRTVAFNDAFVQYTGLSETTLKRKKTLRPFVCADQDKLEKIVQRVCETKKTVAVRVEAAVQGGDSVAVTLIVAVVVDDGGEATNLEFSLIPVEEQQQQVASKRRKVDTKSDEKDSTSGDKLKDESAIYVQL